MQSEAMLNQLGYSPNDALVQQMKRIEDNTVGYEKIRKHILDLNKVLKVDNSFVAMSNTNDCFKIKVEAKTPEASEEAHEKIKHFSDKFKVKLNRLENKDTYYIVGFNH